MTFDSHLHKAILRIAVPSILANITIPLVGLVDMVIAGHISSAWAIGGIAVGTMLFDMLYGCFGFLRVSTAGLTAQAYGAGQRLECGSLLLRSSGIALVGALLIWLLQSVYLQAVLYVMPCSPEVAEFARAYFNIRVWAAPATLMIMTCKGWFIGMQDGTRAMVTDLVVNGVNMLASYLLAVHTPLGAVGVAWGTLIAQWTGLIVALVMIATRYADRFRLSTFDSSRFFRLNYDLFIRSLCFIVVYVGWTAISSAYGDVELAASALMMKLFMLFSFFIDGFAYAGEALVGKTIGEQQSAISNQPSTDKLRSTLNAQPSTLIWTLFAWGTGVGLFFSLLYALFPDALFAALTSDQQVIITMHKYIGWLIAMPIVSMLAFMWDGIFAGATRGKDIRNAMLWAAAAFAVSYFLLSTIDFRLSTFDFQLSTLPSFQGGAGGRLSMHPLYIAYFAHLAARVIYLTAKYFRQPIFNLK
ncbi:MAG: MATE family efflux transporter [Paludibacteraceae bacterium]|nr:MATE family efflux transporter [Paludibacteraceae bacterium]